MCAAGFVIDGTSIPDSLVRTIVSARQHKEMVMPKFFLGQSVSAVVICFWVASGASAQVGRTVISVKDSHSIGSTVFPSAFGDGVHDDTSAIQGKITYALNSSTERAGKGAVIFFPEGTYLVTSAITIPPSGGLDFVGAAAQSETYVIPSSKIVGAYTSTTSAMFVSQNSSHRWSDLILVGRASTSFGYPGAMIYTYSGSTAVVWSVKFDNVRFWANLDPTDTTVATTTSALSLGSGASDNMNSEFSVRDSYFLNFGTAVTVNTEQGLDYVFEQVSACNCRTFLNLQYGGNVNFNTGTFSHCGGSGCDDWVFKIGGVSGGGGTVRIQNARFEAGSQKFVRVDGNQVVQVEGLGESETGTTSAVLEVGGGSVTFSGCRINSFPALNFVTPGLSWMNGSVRFRDCAFRSVPAGQSYGSPPSSPIAPPSGLITGSGRYVYEHCVGIYSSNQYYPFANSTNVSGW
jgi:hypothetical protein